MQGRGKAWQVKGNKSSKISPLIRTSHNVLWPTDAVTTLTPPPKEQVAVSNFATHPKPATQLHARGHQGPCQLGTTVKGHPICSTNVKELVPPVEGLWGQ